jgi:cytochrome c-type biogenesis protein
MPGLFANLSSTFLLGLLTPLTAVCVIPLYPGFVSFLASKLSEDAPGRKQPFLMGVLVASGVITFMLLLGVLFTTLLQVSLTRVIGIVSPVAFGFLAVISILMILNIDFVRLAPNFKAPTARNPVPAAFLYGLFLGAVIVPCNPALIAAFFTKTVAMSTGTFFTNLLNFIVYGIGISFPLLVLALLAAGKSQIVVKFLVKYKIIINRVAGTVMLVVSIYYLFFVFQIFGV